MDIGDARCDESGLTPEQHCVCYRLDVGIALSSGHFCGVAEMISKVDFEVRDGPSPNPGTGRLPVVRP
jgi:hypothetical protein